MKHIHSIKSTVINAFACIIVALSPLKSEVYDGNLLISPKDIQNQIFRTSLIDNNYNIVNTWETDCPVASMGYLLPDSTLIFPCVQDNPIFNTTSALGGRIIKYKWDGSILWDWQCEWGYQLHHDIEPLPNGNILAIAMEEIEPGIRTDVILEIKQEGLNGASIVWEWHTWDHRGSNNPYKFDENLPIHTNDWNHFNAVSFNDNNKIYLSSRTWSEFYVIEWRSDGDILYRWGNPQNYGRGGPEDQVLDANHGVYEIPYGFPGRGNILLFNNRTNQTAPNNLFSSVIELTPDINEDGTYHIEDGKPFGPDNVVWEYENGFHSGSQSGAFRLPNGNTLVTVASESYIFEVTHDKEIVWEYRSENGIIPRAKKYGVEYFFISGDMNDDDILNILDIIQLQNLILENSDLNESQIQLGDMNSDGELNIIDIIYLINHILNS